MQFNQFVFFLLRKHIDILLAVVYESGFMAFRFQHSCLFIRHSVFCLWNACVNAIFSHGFYITHGEIALVREGFHFIRLKELLRTLRQRYMRSIVGWIVGSIRIHVQAEGSRTRYGKLFKTSHLQ